MYPTLPVLCCSNVAGNIHKIYLSKVTPQQVLRWTATSPSRDFREAVWQQSPAHQYKGQYITRIHYPQDSYLAIFGEAVYDFQGTRLMLCTNVRIVKAH